MRRVASPCRLADGATAILLTWISPPKKAQKTCCGECRRRRRNRQAAARRARDPERYRERERVRKARSRQRRRAAATGGERGTAPCHAPASVAEPLVSKAKVLVAWDKAVRASRAALVREIGLLQGDRARSAGQGGP